MRARRSLVAALAGVALAATSCASGSSSGATSTSDQTSPVTPASGAVASVPTPGSLSGSPPAQALSGTLTIYAAASLKPAFERLKAEFTRRNPGVTVAPIDYDGSSTLATQLVAGAPADVFASADDKNMKKVSDAKLIAGTPVEFATNVLEIAVPPGNPGKVETLADLARTGVTTVLCAPQVPCGSAALKALTRAGIKLTPASQEQNVTAVLTKVVNREADAGLVYVTDVKAAGTKVTGIAFPESAAAVNQYPIATLTAATNAAAAHAFLALVTGPIGQQVLTDAGFVRPSG